MGMAYQLFEPAQLGPLQLKNRTVRSAPNEHVSDPDGQPAPEWVRILAELAEHKAGLIITGHGGPAKPPNNLTRLL